LTFNQLAMNVTKHVVDRAHQTTVLLAIGREWKNP
jgi:hypothetical protein